MCTVKVVAQLPDEAAGILTAGRMARLQAKEWQNFSSWMAEQELGPEYGEELLALLAEVVSRHGSPLKRRCYWLFFVSPACGGAQEERK
jgi:ribosome maturation protein Sdo1